MRFTSPPDAIIFNHQVWDLVRQVPPGKVATYGQIARMAGRCTARMVEVYALRYFTPPPRNRV